MECSIFALRKIMKQSRFIFLFFVSTLLILSSCIYQTATLQKEISPEGKITLKIHYKAHKMSFYDMALNKKQWALFFGINDYKQISFPPPGAIIDEKWFYYLSVLDSNLNPVTKRPLLIEKIKREKQIFTGYTQGVFPSQKGFVVVWVEKNSIWYQEFGFNGKELIKKELLYEESKEVYLNRTILSISIHDDCIYLFLLTEPSDMYAENWNISLLKREIHSTKTNMIPNFIPDNNGWFNTRNLEVYLSGNGMYLSWIDAIEQGRNDTAKTRPLQGKVYFATCSYAEQKCDNIKVVIKCISYFDAIPRFIMIRQELYLVVNCENEMWKLRIGENGQVMNEAQKVTDAEKDELLPYFSDEDKFPCKVEIGS